MSRKHQRILPKGQRVLRKDKVAKRRRNLFVAGVSISTVIFLVFVTLPSGNSPRYERDFTIRGVIGEYETTQAFSLREGNILRIRISRLELRTGFTLIISLHGGGSDWTVESSSNGEYLVTIEKDASYKVAFSVNSQLLSGEIFFHVKIGVI